ncbi:gamma-glutamylcyclotransferase a [Neoarius graeffei]|uniref:gamma-glutamylcyclotransferase a n=1 Tax=Neoarius graeffei TaxID=443677 RepID=UPI00298BF2DE|nr:gamma-glutamylcyclotransferase a [Neoarius graeffei]
MSGAGYFLYFAFGSNLLKERLQLNNPSATFHCIARLQGYVLQFTLSRERMQNSWYGGVATIEKCPDEDVWGVVWKMAMEDLSSLDKQEAVDQGVYSPMEVTVETETGPLLCRTYKMNNTIPCVPSPQYKEVICLGAQQNGLPEDYIKKLQAVKTNNYTGPSLIDQIKRTEQGGNV